MTPMIESRQPIRKAIFLISFSNLRYMLPNITSNPQRIRACRGETAKKTRKAIRPIRVTTYLMMSDKGLIFNRFHQKKNHSAVRS